MKFLKLTDFEVYIIPAELTKLLNGSSTKLDITEDSALGTFRKYIGKRYDVDYIFSSKLDANNIDIRDQFVISLLCHIIIYRLYSSLAPHQIPEHRKFDYQEAMEFLREVGRGDNDADFKLKANTVVDDNEPSEIRINSYLKDNHRY
jgi:hypothetical protein